MNCIIVKTVNTAVRTIPLRDGTKLQLNEQLAAIDTGNDFPRPFKLTLEENQPPYPPGRYYIDPASYTVNKYDGLEFSRRTTLVRLPEPSATKAA
jgi:hypothetical protein